jgi:hypothetical protein
MKRGVTDVRPRIAQVPRKCDRVTDSQARRVITEGTLLSLKDTKSRRLFVLSLSTQYSVVVNIVWIVAFNMHRNLAYALMLNETPRLAFLSIELDKYMHDK